MARGKQTCKILKEIRRQIAEANDIEFVTSECRYKGDCLGTCPKCEAEVRYLEQQLRARQLMGKAVMLAGISAGMIAFSGCGSSSNHATADSDKLQGEPMELPKGDDEWDVDGELPVQEVVDSIREAAMMKKGEVEAVDSSIVRTETKKSRTSANAGSLAKNDSALTENGTEHEETTIFGMSPAIPPTFPGGDAELYKFISENLHYPDSTECLEGRVVIRFTVDKTGKVRNLEIVRSKLPEVFNQEALRIVNLIPDFMPGKYLGEPVDMQMCLPINFKLDM